jgi:predicted GH43/DUF377 family glycosyl hydrolase
MIKVKKLGPILEPTSLAFENKAVLNPAIYQDGNDVHIIYRAISEEQVSCLGYAKLSGPDIVSERWEKPYLYPKRKNELRGIEDPRLTKIDDTLYLTYVIHDGKNAITAYSEGPNLFDLKRQGIISPKIKYHEASKIFAYSKLKDDYYFFESFYQEYCGKNILLWHKDCFLLPEKINGKYMLFHRILPDVQTMYFEDFGQLKDKYFWIHYLMHLSENVLLEGEHGFEARHVGGGGPPIKTDEGWIMIYHATQEFNKKRIYHAGVALLDLEHPDKIIARLPYPLFSPTEDYELRGLVNNVVFPTGSAVFEDNLYIYYGAGDSCIALAQVNLENLLDELLKHKKK